MIIITAVWQGGSERGASTLSPESFLSIVIITVGAYDLRSGGYGLEAGLSLSASQNPHQRQKRATTDGEEVKRESEIETEIV